MQGGPAGGGLSRPALSGAPTAPPGGAPGTPLVLFEPRAPRRLESAARTQEEGGREAGRRAELRDTSFPLSGQRTPPGVGGCLLGSQAPGVRAHAQGPAGGVSRGRSAWPCGGISRGRAVMRKPGSHDGTPQGGVGLQGLFHGKRACPQWTEGETEGERGAAGRTDAGQRGRAGGAKHAGLARPGRRGGTAHTGLHLLSSRGPSICRGGRLGGSAGGCAGPGPVGAVPRSWAQGWVRGPGSGCGAQAEQTGAGGQ